MRARQSVRASETDLQSERVCERKGELSTFAERERECVCVCERKSERERECGRERASESDLQSERVCERKGERDLQSG